MDDLEPRGPRRWFQQGGVAVVIVGLAVAAAIIFVRLNPSPAGGGDVSQITFNPRSLQKIPITNVAVQSYDDPRFGNYDAKVVVVEFGDFQCPFCRQAYPIVRELMNRYRDRVLFIYRDYPVAELHPDAEKAAEAGQCAWEQGENQFWAFHDRVFANQDNLSVAALKEYATASGIEAAVFEACLDGGKYAGEVATDYDDGVRAGVRGTPTFFVNNRRYEGAIPKDLFEKIINAELNAAR